MSLGPRDFLVRRVYDGLLNDSKGRGSSRNGALFLENLALEANWLGPLKKPAAKKFVNEFVASRRVSELVDGFKRMSTLRNMSSWVEKERFGFNYLFIYLYAPRSRDRAGTLNKNSKRPLKLTLTSEVRDLSHTHTSFLNGSHT